MNSTPPTPKFKIPPQTITSSASHRLFKITNLATFLKASATPPQNWSKSQQQWFTLTALVIALPLILIATSTPAIQRLRAALIPPTGQINLTLNPNVPLNVQGNIDLQIIPPSNTPIGSTQIYINCNHQHITLHDLTLSQASFQLLTENLSTNANTTGQLKLHLLFNPPISSPTTILNLTLIPQSSATTTKITTIPVETKLCTPSGSPIQVITSPTTLQIK